MKVGLLPKESVQQVDFAFDVYMTTGHDGDELSRDFKKVLRMLASLPLPSTVEIKSD